MVQHKKIICHNTNVDTLTRTSNFNVVQTQEQEQEQEQEVCPAVVCGHPQNM